MLPHCLQRGIQQSKRFFRAPFALSETLDSRRVAGVYKQMKAPKAFDCHNGALTYGCSRGQHGVMARHQLSTIAIPERQLRPTLRTGVGLGVEASVQRVIVLRLTGLTQRKVTHGGMRSIVRYRLHNAKPRPTVRAVDKRVAIAPILWIEELLEASRTRRYVRQNQGGLLPTSVACLNDKSGRADGDEARYVTLLNVGVGWLVGVEASEKNLQLLAAPLDFEADPVRRVMHPAGEP
jgi:hypothetical protein